MAFPLKKIIIIPLCSSSLAIGVGGVARLEEHELLSLDVFMCHMATKQENLYS